MPGPDKKFVFDLHKLRGVYDTMRNGGYKQSWEEFKDGVVKNGSYERRKRLFDTLKSNNDTSAKSYEEFVEGLRFVAPAKPKVSAAPKLDLPKPSSGGKPADGSEFFGKVMRGENVSGSEPIVPKRQDYGGFDKMMTADGRPLTGDATDTWERKLVRDHGKEAGLDDEQIRRIEDGLKVKNIVADMEQTKRDAAKIGRSEASSADLAADASYHDETSREADRRRRESGNYNTQVEFDRLKNNNPLIKTWKLSDYLSSVRNNDEEWLATGEKWYDENEGVFKSRVISNYGNEYVRSESVDEVIGRLKKESEELGRKVDERQLELYGGDNTKRTIADATATLTGQKLIFGMDPQLYHDDYGRSLAAAKRKIDERIETLEGHRDDPGFWAGVGERLSSRDWWTLGASDVADLSQDLVLKQKIENGEELSDADVAYLRSSMYADRDGQFYGKRGFLNRAGKLTADAIPFVAEFVFTGGGMNALQGATKLGMKAATQVGKNALKRAAAREAKELAADVTKDMTKGAAKKALGTRAKMWLLKNTGVVADDLARAGVMANTVGAGRTAGDAIGRYVGSVGVDDEGKFVYEGGVSAGEALLKAEVGNTLEYYTEMLGNHLKIGDWVAKGTEKIGAGKLSKAIKWAGSNKWLEKGGIQDLPSEGLEEEANIVLNSMLVGDNKLSDLWDGETQADIWGGMALSVGFMRSVAAAHEGYVWSRYKMQERKVERADVVAGYRFGDMADWSALKERIDGTTNEDMKGVVMSIMNDDGLHAEQKKAALDYVGSLMQLRGYNLGSVNDANDKEAAAKEAKENGDAGFVGAGEAETEKVEGDMEGGEAPAGPDAPTSNSETAALPSIDDGEQGGPVGAAFNRGREADAQERQDIAIELASGENVEAQEAWNGVVQRINEDADLMVAQQRAQTKEMQHKDGNVRPAILKEKDSEGNDQQVYIVDGNVEMMPDGSMVDKAASDNIVVVYNPATGERKQIDPTADDGISSLGEVTTAEQREADIERSRQAYVQEQIDEAQGTVRVVPGQQLVLPTGEEGVVVAIDAEGEDITVALGDGRQATVQRSELQRIRDEKALADYRQRHGITEEPAAQQAEGYEPAQPQAEGRVAGAPTDYTTDMELTIRDEDGSEKPAMVMGRVRYENGSFVPDENGKIIEYYMGGEVKHAHEDVLSRDVVGYVAPHQTEAAPVEEASAETPATVETTPPPIEQQAEAVPQPMQTEEPMPAQPAIHNADESNLDITSRERVKDTDPMPVREDGEEDWQATTPERAHAYIFNEAGLSRSEGNEFIAAQIQAAQSALMKASSANMPKVGTSIRKYNEAKAKRQEKIDEAQRVLDYWNSVREIQNAIAREENERRAAEDAARHEEAVAQVQAEYEARKRAEAERKAVGNENPMPAITDKWNNATKVDGHSDEIMLPDGTALKGHYVLHESGASSPSHNPETWQKTEGFPMDVNGGSVNDRDYERDLDAQEHTQRIAREYDQRALQNVPVVSNDGVVLSGNGRTMAGELAARDNTDGAYVNYLKEYAPKFGFTAEQVVAMQHPRVSFVPDEAMPYTAETFAKFNQQEMKSQNKTEMAVKLGKTVSDDSFKGIVRTINGYDTLGDFYNDADASLGAVYDLYNAGVVPQAQLAEMVDGVRGQEKLSAVGREFLENMLIGKAFEGAPDVVRMLTAEPLMRQTVITALGEIVDNIALGGGWSLQGELADAVKLCFDARQGGAKYGEIVSTYARQGVLFADPDELQTVADFNNATMLMLADVLNDKRVTLLKTTLQLYNNNARESASGQADMFAGGVRSREDILRDVINFINENYGKRKEIEAARAAAVERRKAEGVVAEDKPGGTRSITSKLGSTLVGTGIQQNGTPPAVGGGSEDTGRSERGTEETPTERELADNLRNRERQRQEKILPNLGNKYSLSAEQANNGELFYQDAEGNTNLAVIPDEIFERLGLSPVPFKLTETMGWHVYDHHAKEAKLSNIGDAIDFVLSIIKNVDHVRLGRNNSYIFSVENGRNKIGKRAVTIVVNSETGEFMGISTSGYETLSKLKERPLLWERGADFAPEDVATPTISTIKSQQGDETLSRTKGQSNASSDGKGKVNSSTAQAKGVKVAENQGATGVQGALTAYEKKEKPVSASSSDIETEPEGKRNGTATPQNGAISEGKESENPSTNQAKGEKVAENQSPSGVEVAVDAAERRVLEEEAKRTASHFPTETREEAAAFDRRVGEMSDLELLSFIKADGNGDVNKALHPSVYDEFDYRHGDEQLRSYDDTLVRLNESSTTLEQAEDMLANIRRDKSLLATDRRAELLGQEDALQDYIVELKNREDQQSGLPKEEVLDGKVAEKKSPSAVEGGLSATKHKANTEPTEAQKDAAAPEPTTEEGSRLAELRTKYPDRVFGEQHEDGSVTYYDEDAFLVSRLLGLEFDGEELTLTKEEADKALEKLLENGHKAAYYGDEYKPKFDENGNRIEQGIDNIQPVGKGVRKGKKIADKNLVLTAYDETSADSESPVATNKSLAGSATSVSSGKGTDLFGNAQGSGKQSSSDGKIDDVGEVLAGARKDMRGEIAKSLANVTEAALVEKPFGKVYKKPDLKKAVESGALREKDAIFYEALFSMVNQQKPKVTQSEMRSKRYIPDYKTKAERWAADTFKQMEVLRQFMELDEPGRDAMMERMLADRYPTREQELAEIEKRKGWNPDYEGHKYAWGEMTTPNPLWVTHEVMNRLGYSVGDKLDVPYGVVKANMSGTGYSIENLKGERASLFGSGMTLDEAIDRIVYLAKLKRGDADVSHPTGLFSFPATKSESGESGRYRVMWGRDYKTREFDSKEDADAFAQTKSGAYVSPIMETKRRFGYKVRFIHPLTGEKLFVDDAEFDTKEEAQAYFDGNFEKLNEATNAKLQDEREMKGEKKMLTADDVVHVTMVHSGNGGWTHAVVIDKKYANNDGKVRIIKEGFASRKDAKAFADRVKGDVLKTVLKHKEDAKKIVYFDTGENSRIGEDYRNGKNVDAEDFMNTFGFRGVQFGNWTNQADRQMAVNQAYDAFMDMARLIGVSPKAMSLNGELGIAFGARGVGGSAAHYERGEVVINLTKTQGAGSLAHEWWHALDNYFARRAGSADDMVTDNRGIEMRDALRKAFNDMLDMVKGSDYAQRSTGKGEYWGRTHEITARLLAEWVDRELKKRGELNTFLSRGAVVERGQQDNYNVYEVLERLAGREPMSFEDYRELPESLKGIPYPSAKEVEQFSASLRHIFDTLEEKVDEETGNVMLYEPTATYETRDGKKVVWRSLFDEMDMRSSDEVAKVSQDTQQGQGQNQVIAPSEIRLRKLKKGETCHVERRYVENGMFDFTGKEKVESAEDVAYIFRQLENAAVENSFLVLVKDGRPTVIHLGVGSYANVMAPYEQALVAYRELKPEQVYFVHNHPSGVLKASRQDQEMLKRIKMAFGEDVVQQGIIIDTTSGKYGEFDMVVDNYDLVQTSGVEAMPQSEGAAVPIKVYQFSRQVFAPDWNPESAFKIVSSESVAEFVSSHRLGKHKKMSFLVVNNSGDVVANVFLPWTKLSDIKRSKDAGELLAGYVHQCGGVSGVLYGNYEYEPDDQIVLSSVSVRMRQLNAQLLDAVHVEHSAYENGWAGVGEPKEGYGVGATDVRSIAQRMDEERGTEVARFVDFLRRGKLGEGESRYFHVGDTGGLLNEYGISGKITVSSSAANSHHNKDKDHLSDTDWVDVFDKINEPIAITRYGDRPNSFRIYTIVEKNGKNICVGVDVNSVGRNVNITNIKTGFARDIANALNEELVYPGSRQELETAIQERSLRHNREVYPEQPYDAAKVVEEFEVPKVWDEKNSDGADEAYLANVNSRFNDELGRLTEENKDKVVLSLGRPSAVLLSAGVEDKSMKLYGNKVIKKMKKHGFALDELRDLPRAVADPIAVFDNYQLEGNRTVLTELQSKGKNIMVAVTLGKDGVDVDFNIVSSVFGKGEDNIVDWLNKGYARYINKEKALNYLHHSDRHISEALSNPKLVSATKVVEDFVNPVVVGEKNEVEDSARYRTSEDLTEEYGDSWLTEQTNDDGRHTTQVKNTINSYKKFGEWVKKDSRGREVSVLDASSGLGLGTHWMRENGMSVDDVEPYPSADREEPTFGSYDEIDKQYDYIISNAVLNVIPDDWRASLLHDMASKLKPGGKLVINVRGAESIRRQGNEGMTRITLDDPSEILVLRPDGSIKAYQKGFTKDELQDWCEEELGDGYTVLKASRDNAGGTYDTAVVVIKNNESTTKGSASELGQPTENGAALANFGAMIGNNSERAKRLSDLSLEISRAGAFGSHQLLHGLNVALDLDVTPKEGGRMSTDHSRYYDLGNGVRLRIADHQGDANTFARFGHPGNNYGIVIKLSRSRFKDKDGVDYLEYVYYGDRIVGAGRQKEIVDGLRTFVESGDLSKLPRADKVNSSGRFKDAALPQQTERSSSAKRLVVEELAEKLHTDINIIEDVNEITHPNAAVQERRRKSKGWYDTATGQVNIVLDNNRDVDDVKASVGHETIAHKGLLELVGEENYDEFLDETYQHLRDDLKQGVDAAAGRAFVDDVTKNGKRAKSYEQHRRTAVDELFGRMAEKPFEEFTEGERTLWQKLKAAVRKLLDKFLGTLKLPKWFELGDNELRYILWRSKERLERGREHPIDLARDIVKREELGLTDEARYNMGDAPETFKARQRRAVENKGTVMPGLNYAQVKVVDVPRHSFTGTGRQAIDKAKIWANGHLVGTHTAHQIGNVFDYNIDKDAIDKFLSSSSTLNSENLGVHLAVLSQLPNVINNSVEVEEHPDYKKVNGKRKTENGVGDSNLLVHRMYGAVQIDGNTYRVKTTMHEHYVKGNAPHDYRVTKIELLISGSPTSNALSNSIGEVLDGQTTKPLSVSSRKSNTTNGSKRANGYVHVAKLLQDVGKSYDLGKKLLEESKIADESTDLSSR